MKATTITGTAASVAAAVNPLKTKAAPDARARRLRVAFTPQHPSLVAAAKHHGFRSPLWVSLQTARAAGVRLAAAATEMDSPTTEARVRREQYFVNSVVTAQSSKLTAVDCAHDVLSRAPIRGRAGQALTRHAATFALSSHWWTPLSASSVEKGTGHALNLHRLFSQGLAARCCPPAPPHRWVNYDQLDSDGQAFLWRYPILGSNTRPLTRLVTFNSPFGPDHQSSPLVFSDSALEKLGLSLRPRARPLCVASNESYFYTVAQLENGEELLRRITSHYGTPPSLSDGQGFNLATQKRVSVIPVTPFSSRSTSAAPAEPSDALLIPAARANAVFLNVKMTLRPGSAPLYATLPTAESQQSEYYSVDQLAIPAAGYARAGGPSFDAIDFEAFQDQAP